MKPYVKFSTNIPEIIKFNFNNFFENDGKFGKQYSYGVEWRGQDANLSATAMLHDKLQSIAPLKDRTLEITKIEIGGGTKAWSISENGKTLNLPQGYAQNPQDTSDTTSTTKTPLELKFEATGDYKEALAKINCNIQKLVAKIQEIEKRIGGLETMHLEEKEAMTIHQELHPKDENLSNLGKEYEDIPLVDKAKPVQKPDSYTDDAIDNFWNS